MASNGGNKGSESPIGDRNIMGDFNEQNEAGIGGDKPIGSLTYSDIMGMKFDSKEKAQAFYPNYALVKGFVVRLPHVGRNKKKEMIWHKYFYNCQGHHAQKYIEKPERIREHRAITKVDCKALMYVHLNKSTQKWHVHQFNDEHSHELTASNHAWLLKTNRVIYETGKALIDSIVAHVIKPCHILGYIANLSGGYGSTGFHSKDLYNYICRARKDVTMAGHAEAPLNYLIGMAANDPMFFMRYKTDGEGRLENLFWADGIVRGNFECFGDVVAFDSTYKINKYNLSFVIFLGVNHHRQTITFRCALIGDEKEETYKWVLDVFVEAMQGKRPSSIVIDSDKAMRKAIKQVFPSATH